MFLSLSSSLVVNLNLISGGTRLRTRKRRQDMTQKTFSVLSRVLFQELFTRLRKDGCLSRVGFNIGREGSGEWFEVPEVIFVSVLTTQDVKETGLNKSLQWSMVDHRGLRSRPTSLLPPPPSYLCYVSLVKTQKTPRVGSGSWVSGGGLGERRGRVSTREGERRGRVSRHPVCTGVRPYYRYLG